MPPKKGSQPSKKTVEKQKDKIIEDKTFGLKNKKGKKTQQFIKGVQQQVKYGNQSREKIAAMEVQAKKDKEKIKAKDAEMKALFTPVASSQKVSKGADPKSVLCAFYKQGLCTKGDKCKFSHDLTMEAKSEKRSMYVDVRDEADATGDTMENWDEDELRRVVNKKHGKENAKPKTDIVCKHFLFAIEKGVYGWFWECPNGGDKCMYRHALPPGFILKKDKKDMEEQKETITIEELVERERGELINSGKKLTPVTLESFLKWKNRKIQEKKAKAEKERTKKRKAFEQGKMLGISGREMFEFNPETVQADDDEVTDEMSLYTREPNGDEEGMDNEQAAGEVHDLTNMDFSLLEPQESNTQPSAQEEVVIDEILFLGEADDPLNEAILSRIKAGDLFEENSGDSDDDSS